MTPSILTAFSLTACIFSINAPLPPTNGRVPSLLQHVGARCRCERPVPVPPHCRWHYLFTRAGVHPFYPVGPPTPLVALGAFKPLVSILHRLLIGPVAPILAWWTDDTSNVTTGPKHKAHRTAGKLRDAPGRLPGNDTILLGTNGVDVLADLPKVNGHTLQDNLIGLDQVVLQVGVAQVERMGSTGHARPIRIPVEQVEDRGLLAHQEVVDDIAPNQVVGPQPVEHRRHRAAIQVATFHHLPLDIGYLWLVNEHRRIAYLTEILQRDQEGRRINRVVPDGRKKRQGH